MNDVAIVGAGPAGCWAAYQLAEKGARVALIDGSHPREKPCGGGVTGRALALVSSAIDIERLPASVIRSARFLKPDGSAEAMVALDEPCPRREPLIVASRREFDGHLLAAARAAGAQLAPFSAIDIVRYGDGFAVRSREGEITARFLVGADGANSLVRRRFARPFRRAELSIATGYFAHGFTSHEIVVELTGDPPGYIWSFPRPTHLAIGICAQADSGMTAARLRARTRAWIDRTRIAEGARLEPYSWPIPSLSAHAFEHLILGGDGWFLVGDAAGLVDPITREGIFFALLSAEWAAESIASSHPSAAERYRERVRDEIGEDLARAARYKAGFFQPRFTRLMIDALLQSAAVRRVMADLVAGRQGYGDLRWRLAKTLEWRVAWRWLQG